MGGLIGALIGRHLEHQEQARDEARAMVLPKLRAYGQDPASANMSREEADNLLGQALDMHWIDKNYGKVLKRQFDVAQKKYEAGQNAERLERDTASTRQQPTNYGVPTMDPSQIAPGLNSAMTPSQQFNFSGPPTAQLPAPPGQDANAVQQEQVKSAILQRLMPAILAAKAQQAGGGMPGGAPAQAPGPAQAAPQQRGMPQPPFTDGTGAGPVPPQGQPAPQPAPQQNPAPTLARVGSVAGGTGFGGPSPAPPLVPMPAIVANDLNDTKPHLFPFKGISLADRAQRDAYAKAMGESVSAPASAALARQKEQLDYEATAARLKATPGFNELPPRIQFSMITGKNYTPEPAPRGIPGLIQGKQAPAGALDFSGSPLIPNTFYTRKEDYQGVKYYPAVGVTHAITIRDANSSTGFSQISLDRAQNEVGREKDVLPDPAYVPTEREVIVNGVRFVPQADGSWAPVNVQTNTQTRTFKPIPGSPAGSPAPATLTPPPGTTEGQAPGQTPAGPLPTPEAWSPSARGPIATTPRTAPTSPALRSRPATVSKPGASVGDRPLTPEQTIKNSQIAEQLNNTIGTIKNLQAKAPMLASLITSGKIGLQVDPQQGFWRGIVNKNMKLTPAEADLASDWQLLSEGIMQMRIPLGGAAFRGPEGLGIVESNKGILSQHPEIIKRVLDGALREFRAQRNPLVEAGKKYKYDVKPEYEAGYNRAGQTLSLPDGGGQVMDDATLKMFYDAAGKDPGKVRSLAGQHNWKIPN